LRLLRVQLPVRLAFDSDPRLCDADDDLSSTTTVVSAVIIFDYVSDLLFIVDVAVNFRTAFYRDGDFSSASLVKVPKEIALHYLRYVSV
jgi:hypothetical protein